METLLIVLAVILAVIVIDLIIGAMFAAPRYGNKLEKLKQKLRKERLDENLELESWKVLQWTTLALVAWWFVFPYEWFTRWRQWAYPYCTEE